MICTHREATPGRVRFIFQDGHREAVIVLYYHKGMFAEGVQTYIDRRDGAKVVRLSSYRPKQAVGECSPFVDAMWDKLLGCHKVRPATNAEVQIAKTLDALIERSNT